MRATVAMLRIRLAVVSFLPYKPIIRSTSIQETRTILTTTDYPRVYFEAVFQRGEVLAPVLQTSKLRDEAFGRFWVDFSCSPLPSPLFNPGPYTEY
jgi:hypothetical protein